MRLLLNLPPEARFIIKYSPAKDWTWDKEVQSQILHTLDAILVSYMNANRKKGTKKAKVPEQAQPDYVKEAKKNMKNVGKERLTEEEYSDLKAFFDAHNPGINKLSGKGEQNGA